MSYTNYRQMWELIPAHKPFRGNSMRAELVMTSVLGLGNRGDVYRITSYSTPIFEQDLGSGRWLMSDKQYSMTTSRQQNLIRGSLGITYKVRGKIKCAKCDRVLNDLKEGRLTAPCPCRKLSGEKGIWR